MCGIAASRFCLYIIFNRFVRGCRRARKQFIIMKKSILILASLFAAMFVNAQITLDGTIFMNRNCTTLVDGYGSTYYDCDKIPVVVKGYNRDSILQLYNLDCTLYKEIILPIQGGQVQLITKNIFTTDNKIAFLIEKYDWENHKSYLYCVDENKRVIKDFGELNGDISGSGLRLVSNEYKLFVETYYEGVYQLDVYSLPGNGEAQAVSTPSSRKRSARKIAREGQVLVQTDNNTYTLTGVEVK